MQSLSRCHPSSTFSSLLFICLLQSYPTPTFFALLLSSQASSWWCLGIGYGQQWEHKTASFLCSWCFVLKTVNQDMASESYSRVAVNPKIQVVHCKCFFVRRGLIIIIFKKFENVTLLQQTQLCSIGTSLTKSLTSLYISHLKQVLKTPEVSRWHIHNRCICRTAFESLPDAKTTARSTQLNRFKCI